MRKTLEETTWEARVRYDVHTDRTSMICLEALCEAVVRMNMVWINEMAWETKTYPPCCLEDAGVQYVYPTACPGMDLPCQTIRGAAEMLETQRGTCIDIACYMAAQLRLRGKMALVYLENMKDSFGRPMKGEYHVILKTSRGRVDYTQELIDGYMTSCNIECGNRPFRPLNPEKFNPASRLPR